MRWRASKCIHMFSVPRWYILVMADFSSSIIIRSTFKALNTLFPHSPFCCFNVTISITTLGDSISCLVNILFLSDVSFGFYCLRLGSDIFAFPAESCAAVKINVYLNIVHNYVYMDLYTRVLKIRMNEWYWLWMPINSKISFWANRVLISLHVDIVNVGALELWRKM